MTEATGIGTIKLGLRSVDFNSPEIGKRKMQLRQLSIVYIIRTVRKDLGAYHLATQGVIILCGLVALYMMLNGQEYHNNAFDCLFLIQLALFFICETYCIDRQAKLLFVTDPEEVDAYFNGASCSVTTLTLLNPKGWRHLLLPFWELASMWVDLRRAIKLFREMRLKK